MLKDIFASISKPKAGPIEYVIVGLGNPGIQYEGTRHNVGFMVLDYIAKQCNVSIDRMKFKGMTCDTTLNGKRVLLLKPMTYMNLSGDSVRDAMNFYKLTPDRVIVVYDDISLQPGKLRIRLKGSHGGQNGMRSIIEQCGTDTFPRIKMGIQKFFPSKKFSCFGDGRSFVGKNRWHCTRHEWKSYYSKW